MVDGGQLLEVHAGWARNIIVGFARIEGMEAGVVANNPDGDGGRSISMPPTRGARFIRFWQCQHSGRHLRRRTGFLPVSSSRSAAGIIRHGAKMLYAYASCTTPS